MKVATPEETIRRLFQALLNAFGPQNWWPARTPFEVVVGAILVQNTAWTNAQQALARLRAVRCLSVRAVRLIPLTELEELIRPAGFYRQKAHTLKAFVAFIDREYGGSIANLCSQNMAILREQLLRLHGIGPETADCILLYAAQHPVFVVDAYARRVLSRHGLVADNSSYDKIQKLVGLAVAGFAAEASGLAPIYAIGKHPPSAMSKVATSQPTRAYNEMHGLLVAVGKRFCRKIAPDCESCPLRSLLPPPDLGLTAYN